MKVSSHDTITRIILPLDTFGIKEVFGIGIYEQGTRHNTMAGCRIDNYTIIDLPLPKDFNE
jgi:hypothetical protein